MVKKQGGSLTMSPSFFKVYLPFQSSHHLRLPPAYVKRFSGDIPKDVILKDTSGNLWHIEIEEDVNDVSFKQGWQKFATDHSLGYGDFLIFEYKGNSLFNVKIFGKNGSIKKQSSANNFVDGELKMISTTVEFEDELNEGQSRQRSIHSRKQKFKEEISKTSRKSKGFCDANQRKLQGIHSNTPELTTTTNPHFVASVNLKTPYHLEIPYRWVRENCLKLKPKMMFRTQDGKVWPVNVGSRKTGRNTFGSGWKEFWTGNSISPQDTCRFEFIVQKNRTLSREILVTILRTITTK